MSLTTPLRICLCSGRESLSSLACCFPRRCLYFLGGAAQFYHVCQKGLLVSDQLTDLAHGRLRPGLCRGWPDLAGPCGGRAIRARTCHWRVRSLDSGVTKAGAACAENATERASQCNVEVLQCSPTRRREVYHSRLRLRSKL